MKYNLKNRPDAIGAPRIDIEDWFVGFERELRGKLEIMDKKRPTWPCRYILCEVLGE